MNRDPSNTLAWNPRKKRIEGSYRGVVLEKGKAYQMGNNDSAVLTAYWTGLVRDGNEPQFRLVDSEGGNAEYGEGAEVSAAFMLWFEELTAIGALRDFGRDVVEDAAAGYLPKFTRMAVGAAMLEAGFDAGYLRGLHLI